MNTNHTFNASVVYIRSDVPSYVRVNRTLPMLTRLFPEVHYIGATRKASWDDSRTPGVQYHIADYKLGNGWKTAGGVAKFYGTIKRVVDVVKPDVVIAVDEEYTLPFVTGLIKRPPHLVLDLYDSIAMRFLGFARHMNPLWKYLSQFAMNHVDALVEVCEQRLDWHRVTPKVTGVVYNSPRIVEDIDPYPGLPENFIYVNGTLEDNIHGVETILAAVEQVKEMEIVFTGKPVGKFILNSFLKHPKVHNLGKVDPFDIFRILKASKGVWTHYTPTRPNYIYGAPNKLYEAMMVGIPVLINSENRASSLIVKHGFGLVSPYGKIDNVVNDLRYLLSDSPELEASCLEAKKIFRSKYAWDLMENEWERVLTEIGVPKYK